MLSSNLMFFAHLGGSWPSPSGRGCVLIIGTLPHLHLTYSASLTSLSFCKSTMSSSVEAMVVYIALSSEVTSSFSSFFSHDDANVAASLR